MNELIFQAGGTLVLDEPWAAQPSEATFTLLTMQGQALSALGGGFTDISEEDATVDDLQITFPATNHGAKVITPSATAGTVGDITSNGYCLLIDRGGRKYWQMVSEYDLSGDDISSIRFDSGLPFALKVGDKGYGVRVSYAVDFSSVTSDYTGQLQAIWRVTVDGTVHVVKRIYDLVKQTLQQPATWADVLVLRPDAADHLSNIPNKEALVTKAWETVIQELYDLRIRHNLIVPDGSTYLRDAVVSQTIYNMVIHNDLPAPRIYENQGDAYLDRLLREKDKNLGRLSIPVDANQDSIISPSETRSRRAVFFNAPPPKTPRGYGVYD